MRRVLLRGPIDLVRHGTGEAVRAEVVADGLVPIDVDDAIRPFASLRRSGEAETSTFVALGDRTLTERPRSWSASGWRQLSRTGFAEISDLAFNAYEYLRQPAESGVHGVSGRRTWATINVTVEAVAGRSIVGVGYTSDLRNDEIVAATVARMRADAVDGILLKGDAVLVSRHLPRWQLKADYHDKRNLVLELADYTPRPEERSFRIDRRDVGIAMMQASVAADRDVDGEIFEWDAAAAPLQQDDLVRLAAMRAPETTGWAGMSVDLMPSGLVHAWHDVRNAARIVADGGRPAAERVLAQTLQLLDHRHSLDGETWSNLRDRLALEGIAAPGMAPTGHGPRP
jgi:hypothetical protein